MERLDRGVVAIRQGEGKVFVGWRLLGTDEESVGFNLYRATDGGEPVKLNAEPLTQATNFVDATADATKANRYFVRAVVNGNEQESDRGFTMAAGAEARPYLSIPLQDARRAIRPTTRRSAISMATASTKSSCTRWAAAATTRRRARRPSRSSTPTSSTARSCGGSTSARTSARGRTTRSSWSTTSTATAGPRSPARRPTARSTARARSIGDATADHRNADGYILAGPEFLTVFDGLTGAALATADYIPPRGDVAAWGDDYGNRVDRFLACVAYLDGQRPSLVMCRGYYTRAVLAAWNWRDGKLTHVWTFDSDDGTPGNRAYRGQGNHNISVGDVDGDGRDEIVYGSCVIDDNGQGLYSTGLGHGDAMHCDRHRSRPARPGGLQSQRRPRERRRASNCATPAPASRSWGVASHGPRRRRPGAARSTSIRGTAGSRCGARARASAGCSTCKGEKIADAAPRVVQHGRSGGTATCCASCSTAST